MVNIKAKFTDGETIETIDSNPDIALIAMIEDGMVKAYAMGDGNDTDVIDMVGMIGNVVGKLADGTTEEHLIRFEAAVAMMAGLIGDVED